MKKASLITLVSLVYFSSFAQNRADLRYFDQFWNPVLTRASATYYRKIKDADSVYQVQDYYLNDSLCMDGFFSTISPSLVHHGRTTWYFPSGRINKIGYFKKGRPVGIHREYYENGQMKSEILHDPRTEFHLNRYDENGNSLLKDGYGVYTTRYMNYDYFNEVFDSQLLRSFYIDENRDTIYGTATKPAVYAKGGMKQFQKNLQNHMKYPDNQRKGHKEGTVLVSFVVDDKGKMKNVQVVKSLGGDFDALAIRIVRRNRDWKPAQYGARYVQMRFVVPVVFLHTYPNYSYSPYYGPTFQVLKFSY
jgi:TonB family protein